MTRITKRTRTLLVPALLAGVAWLIWPREEESLPADGMAGAPHASTRTSRRPAHRTPADFTPGGSGATGQAHGSEPTNEPAPEAHRRSRPPGIPARGDDGFLGKLAATAGEAGQSSDRHDLRRLRLGLPVGSGRTGGSGLRDALGHGAGESIPATAGAEDDDRSVSPDTLRRVAAIREMAARGFDQDEMRAAYEFIGSAPAGMPRGEHRWLVDELFIGLRNQEVIPADLDTRLAGFAADRSQDPVVRDYALQHLGHLHQQGACNAAMIEEVLWRAVNEWRGDLAGSALIALSGADRDGRLAGNVDFASVPMAVALDPSHSVATRGTALSLVGVHGAAKAHLEALDRIASDPSNDALLRLGALSALATDQAGLPALQRNLGDADPRVREAAGSLLAGTTR